MLLWAINDALRSNLSNVVGAHERVTSRPQRVTEPTLFVNGLRVSLQQVVHEKVVPQNRQRQAVLDQCLFAPPIVLQHQGYLSVWTGHVEVFVVTSRVCVRAHATDAHHYWWGEE